MSIFSSTVRAFAWLALTLPCAQALAQTDAADPRTAVPATLYEPAVRYRAEPAPAATPDRNWIASNAAVAGGNAMAGHAGHADHADHAGHAHHAGMAMPAAAPAPQQCRSGKDGKSCCAGMMGGAGHEHHAGMSMPSTEEAARQCTSCGDACACCGGKPAAGPHHGAAS